MSHVFISYVHDDQALVDQLSTDLRALGVEVWLDRERIRPGERWKDAIRKAIREGDFFLCCFSTGYESRDKSYINEELTLAIDELRQYPVDRTWFIPILLSPCQIPSRSIGAGETICDLQWVNLCSNWRRGIQQIASVVLDRRRGTLNQALKFCERPPIMNLRSVGRDDLSIKEAILLIREHEFYEKDWNQHGGAFLHMYSLLNEDQEGVIAATETGLLWQQRAEGFLVRRQDEKYLQVDKHLKALNEKSYANFSDWRLPTLEEALSIIGMNGRVDYRFGEPRCIWTSDFTSEGHNWVVDYTRGQCYPMDTLSPMTAHFSVRAVRTWIR